MPILDAEDFSLEDPTPLFEMGNPLATKIKSGTPISAVSVGFMWSNNCRGCCNMSIVVEDQSHDITVWWADYEHIKILIRAETGKAEHMHALNALVIESLNSLVE